MHYNHFPKNEINSFPLLEVRNIKKSLYSVYYKTIVRTKTFMKFSRNYSK